MVKDKLDKYDFNKVQVLIYKAHFKVGTSPTSKAVKTTTGP